MPRCRVLSSPELLPTQGLLPLLGLLLLLAGCTSPNPTLYVLAPLPGDAAAGAPATVELREIGLARYLERSQIVRSSEGYRLDVLSNEWWGEPLGAMLSRVLVQELTNRLPGSTVFAESGAITVNPAATVAVNIERLDADATGATVLIAQVEVSGKSTATRNVHLTVTPPAAGTPGLVEAMSQAIAQLADAIAGMLRG
jgi:uncharacterized lipoprotein YmbA